MDRVLDLATSRQARTERCERFRGAANDLLVLLDEARQHISPEFMSFLLAMAASDQALYYAQQGGQPQYGHDFLDSMQLSANQIFESQMRKNPPLSASDLEQASARRGQLIDLFGGGSGVPTPQA